jgi:chitinase
MFANSILEAYEHFHLDGIDIDWEYPGQPGNDANVIDVQHDTANFLLFLQLLRTVLPPTAKITAATLTQPWVGPDGMPLKDMTAFAQVLDWILIMNYDVWGSSATPGANAPLSDACGNATQSNAGAHASVHSWTTAGFPANQITLGLPSYGYLSRSSAHRLHNRRAKGVHAMDASGTLSVKNDNGGSDNGQIQFRDLVRQGALVRSTSGASDSKFVGAHGFERLWDECSSTPFLRSENAGQIITYDDPESLGLKADFARQAGLKGVNMFDVHGDTDNWDLIDAARTSLHNT